MCQSSCQWELKHTGDPLSNMPLSKYSPFSVCICSWVYSFPLSVYPGELFPPHPSFVRFSNVASTHTRLLKLFLVVSWILSQSVARLKKKKGFYYIILIDIKILFVFVLNFLWVLVIYMQLPNSYTFTWYSRNISIAMEALLFCMCKCTFTCAWENLCANAFEGQWLIPQLFCTLYIKAGSLT